MYPCQYLHTRVFFDACDGLFTNYNWKEENLVEMNNLALQDRQADIYVGVDVFARGEVVGGMFETNKVRNCELCLPACACTVQRLILVVCRRWRSFEGTTSL